VAILTSLLVAATSHTSRATSAHDFTLRTIDGRDLPLKRFRGQLAWLPVISAAKLAASLRYAVLE
jgi:hypothetical protein